MISPDTALKVLIKASAGHHDRLLACGIIEGRIEALEEALAGKGAELEVAYDGWRAAEAEAERLTELVDDLTLQGTYGEHDANTLDSGAISAYADGLRDMARRGRVRITHERHRRVIAVFTEEELERQRAVVDAALAAPPKEATDG